MKYGKQYIKERPAKQKLADIYFSYLDVGFKGYIWEIEK